MKIYKYFVTGIVLVSGVFFLFNLDSSETTDKGDGHYHGDLYHDEQHDDSAHTDDEAHEGTGVTVVARDLEIPWDIAFLPDESMLITERPGRVVHTGSDETIDIKGIEHTGEAGLLGIELHPEFEKNRYVYLYQTTQASNGGLRNAVIRYRYEDNKLKRDREIVSNIAGAPYHDGGRIRFGPNGYLWVTVGDATTEDTAQDLNTRAGSILRLRDDGSIPENNPFGNAVWSYGHRNPQGITWDEQGRLWSTEHGRSGIQSGMDELNLIEKGVNYGWPDIEGGETREGMQEPVAHSGSDVTWAPASAVYWDGSVFFGGLRGAAIYEAVLNGENVVEIREHFSGSFGRIRSIRLGPDSLDEDQQAFYITTSNRDGRGDPRDGDDKIIRIDPEQAFR